MCRSIHLQQQPQGREGRKLRGTEEGREEQLGTEREERREAMEVAAAGQER